jgi:hypothetical protein
MDEIYSIEYWTEPHKDDPIYLAHVIWLLLGERRVLKITITQKTTHYHFVDDEIEENMLIKMAILVKGTKDANYA